jgi:hypothetical protein
MQDYNNFYRKHNDMDKMSSLKSMIKLKAESLTVKRGLEIITGLVLLVLGVALIGLGSYVFYNAATGWKDDTLVIPSVGEEAEKTLTVAFVGVLPFAIGLLLIIGSVFLFYGQHRPAEKLVETAMKRQESVQYLSESERADAERKRSRIMQRIPDAPLTKEQEQLFEERLNNVTDAQADDLLGYYSGSEIQQ